MFYFLKKLQHTTIYFLPLTRASANNPRRFGATSGPKPSEIVSTLTKDYNTVPIGSSHS